MDHLPKQLTKPIKQSLVFMAKKGRLNWWLQPSVSIPRSVSVNSRKCHDVILGRKTHIKML